MTASDGHPPHDLLRLAHERLLTAAAELSRTSEREKVVSVIADAVRDALGFRRVEVHVRAPGGRRSGDPPGAGPMRFDRLEGHVIALGDLRGILVVDEPDERDLTLGDRLRALRVFADLAGASLSASARLEAARDQARHDPLTGLLNRAALMARLQDAVQRCRERGTLVALLFCDLNGFKAINDELGHATGDDVLRCVAQRLSESVRPQDVVARLGGDEFVVLCEDINDPTATAIVERLHGALRRAIVVDGHALEIKASIGTAIGDGAMGPTALLRVADTDMYVRKSLGREATELRSRLVERHVA